MSQNITDVFVDNLIKFSQQSFTNEDVAHAKKCVLDYIGVTLAGSKEYSPEEEMLFNTKMALGGMVITPFLIAVGSRII